MTFFVVLSPPVIHIGDSEEMSEGIYETVWKFGSPVREGSTARNIEST
jgi:hypothetical protein